MGNVKQTIIDIFVILYRFLINHVPTAQFLSIVHVLFFQYLHEPMIFFEQKLVGVKVTATYIVQEERKEGII